MKTLQTLLIVCVSCSALLAQEPSRHWKESNDPVANVLLQNAKGFETGDLTLLDALWANDDGVTVFENGHANYGWSDYRDHHLKPELEEMKNVRYRLSDIKTRVAGMTAWATFKYSIVADLKERRVDAGGLGTAVLEKRGNDWKIVHWHTSSPRRAQPQQATPPK